VYSIDDPYIYKEFKPTGIKGSTIDLLTRKKKPQDIAIYGRSLHTICFINGLLNRGVNGKRIHYIIPPPMSEEENEENEKTVVKDISKFQLEKELKKISDPDPFQDPEIEKKILDNIKKCGVDV